MTRFKAYIAAAAFGAAVGTNPMHPATAQSYPTKSVRIVLPLAVGTGLDIVTRVVGQQLSAQWGQPVLVENRPGAGGLLGAQAVASAAPDGYTLLAGASSVYTIMPMEQEKATIDVNRDFTQIGMISGSAPMYVAVSPRLGVSSFPEFVALAKSRPREIAVGTNGTGLPYYAAVAIEKVGGVPISVVPYARGGTVAAVVDIKGGRVHATIGDVYGLLGALQAGDLKLIGVMSPERDPHHPGLPTVAESLPGLTALGFMSLAAPRGTPEAVVRRASESLRLALETPEVKRRFVELEVPIRILSPEQTNAFIEKEQKIWWPLIRKLTP